MFVCCRSRKVMRRPVCPSLNTAPRRPDLRRRRLETVTERRPPRRPAATALPAAAADRQDTTSRHRSPHSPSDHFFTSLLAIFALNASQYWITTLHSLKLKIQFEKRCYFWFLTFKSNIYRYGFV